MNAVVPHVEHLEHACVGRSVYDAFIASSYIELSFIVYCHRRTVSAVYAFIKETRMRGFPVNMLGFSSDSLTDSVVWMLGMCSKCFAIMLDRPTS